MILQVIPSDHRRGSEVFGLDLGEALSCRGRRLDTVALAPGESGDALPVGHLGPTRRSPSTVRELRRRLPGAELVIAHGSTTLAVTALATLGTATRFVYRSVGDPAYWSSTRARRLRVAAYLRRAAAVAVLWPGAADFVTGRLHVPRGRLAVIPNGVPSARFAPMDEARRSGSRDRFGLPRGVPVVLSVGSLTPEKDLSTTLRALAHLPEVWLLVVGDGPLRGSLRRQADELAPGRVVFAGTTADPASVYGIADVIALSSRTEGMPAVLIEAAFCGVPAVASDVGGVHQIVLDGQSGRLVAPGEPLRLAAALRDVLAGAPALGEVARAHCLSHFEIGIVADAWDELLARLNPPGAP